MMEAGSTPKSIAHLEMLIEPYFLRRLLILASMSSISIAMPLLPLTCLLPPL